MLDDVTLALLGDRAAQERITARGELLPCAHCGCKYAVKRRTESVNWFWMKCNFCGAESAGASTEFQALENWNTRARILSAEELERLKGLEGDDERVDQRQG